MKEARAYTRVAQFRRCNWNNARRAERERERLAIDRRAAQFEFIRLIPPADSAGLLHVRAPHSERDQIILIPTIIEHSLLINWTKLPTLRRPAEIRANCGLRRPPITPLSPPLLSFFVYRLVYVYNRKWTLRAEKRWQPWKWKNRTFPQPEIDYIDRVSSDDDSASYHSSLPSFLSCLLLPLPDNYVLLGN